MAKNEKKVPLKEAMRLNLRAVKLLHQRCPGLFPSTVLHAVASAVSPYVSIYFSARLIDELAARAGQKNWSNGCCLQSFQPWC